MPFYQYIAKNQFGETVRGKVEAKSIEQAAHLLVSRDLLVVRLTPFGQDIMAVIRSSLFGIRKDDVVNFTRQLATMITAGLPLSGALAILVRQAKAEFSKLVSTLLQDVEGGMSLAKAMEKHPKVFHRLYVQLVYAGEAGGVLDAVLERLADNLEKDKEFRAKTKGALIYPVIVIIALAVTGAIMMIFVIPKLTEMYKDFGAELPFITQLLITISNFMVSFWWLMAVGIGGIIFALRSWYKTHKGRLAIDRFLLRMPIVGELIQKMTLTEFARTLSLLLGSGISLLEALDIVTEGVENLVYREALRDATSQIEKGIPLSQALSAYEEFPPILHQMINVGEETGKLDEVLKKLSTYFESESEHAVKNMTAAIEPLIMIVLGIGVGAMVIAVIMPIYNLTSQF